MLWSMTCHLGFKISKLFNFQIIECDLITKPKKNKNIRVAQDGKTVNKLRKLKLKQVIN